MNHCTQHGCRKNAAHRLFWPGWPPSLVCLSHYEHAKKVAEAMGFYLHAEELPKLQHGVSFNSEGVGRCVTCNGSVSSDIHEERADGID